MTRLENDLISRKALIKYFKENSNGDYTEWFLENIEDAINDAPTIEADSGEAVAWMDKDEHVISNSEKETKLNYYQYGGEFRLVAEQVKRFNIPLSKSPQKCQASSPNPWVDLTDEQIGEVIDAWETNENLDFANDFAKAISDALKEVNHG